jgi:hypothetical protein
VFFFFLYLLCTVNETSASIKLFQIYAQFHSQVKLCIRANLVVIGHYERSVFMMEVSMNFEVIRTSHFCEVEGS